MNLLDWLIENLGWIFLGVGVALAGRILAVAASRKAGLSSGHRRAHRNDLALVLKGAWKGVAEEVNTSGSPTTRYDVARKFTVIGASVEAQSTTRHNKAGKIVTTRYKLVGKVTHGRFVHLDYHNTDPGETTFGSEIIHVSDDGERFDGWFVGLTPERSSIVTGRIIGIRAK